LKRKAAGATKKLKKMGLAFETTGKYVSERHAAATETGKLTAGEVSKRLKKVGINISAKEVVESYKTLTGREPEWHHSGFYKPAGGHSTMGRTFFFAASDVNMLALRNSEVADIKARENAKAAAELAKAIAEEARKREIRVQGFYYEWTCDCSGKYGKMRSYKKLRVYEGNELNKPQNFMPLSDAGLDAAKSKVGKSYFGWDEPLRSEFE
jgi:hypothetical protein